LISLAVVDPIAAGVFEDCTVPQKRQIPRTDDGSPVSCWLLAKSPPGTPDPTDYWLSTLPDNTRCRRWSGWPSCAGLSNTTTARSKTAWFWSTSRPRNPGWHRHLTLASLSGSTLVLGTGRQ
jgi:hypothetical protein